MAMSEDRRRYFVAKVEDADLAGTVIPGTAVEARTSMPKPQVPGDASDSGYSSYANSSYSAPSHASDPPDAATAVAIATPRGNLGQSAGRPARDNGKKVVVHHPAETRRESSSGQEHEWKYTLPNHAPSSRHHRQVQSDHSNYQDVPDPYPPQQYPPQQLHYRVDPQYHHLPPHPSPQGPPARPQRPSLAPAPRPSSYHAAMAFGTASWDNSQRGPPPCQSAFYACNSGHPSGYSGHRSEEYFSRIPSNPSTATRSAAAPTSPTSPTASMSARRGGPVAGAPRQFLARTNSLSARRGSQIQSRYDQDESYPVYSSDDDDRRENMLVRRPSVNKRNSVQGVPQSILRTNTNEFGSRASYSDVGPYEYSDNHDSDRTSRAVISAQPSRSRRPSVSTRTSSGRDKATSVSGESDLLKVMVEDAHGRRHAYMTRAEVRQRLREQQRDLDDDLSRNLEGLDIEEELAKAERKTKRSLEHQRREAGAAPVELTAETLRHASSQGQGRSDSHISRARSQRSKGSGSKISGSSSSHYITVQSGGTILQVTGGAKIEMRPSEEGGAPQLIVTTASGRDSGYHGSSKSSKSRSRLGSDTSKHRRAPEGDEHDS